MANWLSLLHNGLWLAGLTVALVAFGVASYWALGQRRGRYRAHRTGVQSVPAGHGRSRRRVWLGWGLVAAGLLLAATMMASAAIELRGRVNSLQSHLAYLEQLGQGGLAGQVLESLQKGGEHLAGLHTDLAGIQDLVGPLLPAGRLLRWVPRYGGDLAAASDLMEAAVGVASAADRTYGALSPALDLLAHQASGAGAAQSMGERLLPVAQEAVPALRRAQQELAAVRQVRQRVDASALSPRTALWLEKLDRTLPWLETAVDGALLAPGLLGAGTPRTYLLLAQNNHELRPTGGFVSGVGELQIEDGRWSRLAFDDSYAVDNDEVPHELAPPDFRQTLFGELVFFRDSNWDTDFPTSARRAMDIYARDRGVHADGVIAFDLTALRLLVAALGPMQIEGVPEDVTGENVLQVAQDQWSRGATELGLDWWLHRKDFMGEIASVAMQRLLAGEGVDPLRLLQALQQALDEKHMLIYLQDPQSAELLRARNWDGALAQPPLGSDALMVVDSNVGFNKVDPNVERSIRYQVDLGAEGGPKAQLTLTYANRSRRPAGSCIQEARYGDSYADMMDRCFWNYVRIYVPAGSRLLRGPDLPWPAGSLLTQAGQPPPQLPIVAQPGGADRAVWTAFFELAPGAERTLVFEYTLPPQVPEPGADGLTRYHLSVQRQPGTEAVPLEVQVLVPADAEVATATPAGLEPVSTDLRSDREFKVTYRRSESGP